MPITEWLGATPWSNRMISIIDSILEQAPHDTPAGPIPSTNLEVNEHGLMFQTINPQTGEVLNKTIHDNWGYNYNGFYTAYLLDGTDRYRTATRKALAGLKTHCWKFPWQGWGSDGIADSVEGAINLHNRESDIHLKAGESRSLTINPVD